MAIYHFSGQIIGRSAGRSATAAAAYRAAEKIVDRTTGETWDFTRKRGVFGTAIVAPSHAPVWALDRAELWNRVEESETRRNSQLAREFDIAIPVELNEYDRIELVRDFVQHQFVDRGMVADVAFHDFESHNPHCHVMLTTRDITSEGFGAKNRKWNDRTLIDGWRKEWGSYANRYLERAGLGIRIDHRSYEAQGVDLIPSMHIGPGAATMERDGTETRVGKINRRIYNINTEYMDKQVSLEAERLWIIAEIERIRQEALAHPSVSGSIEIGEPLQDVSLRAKQGSAMFGSGVGVSIGDRYKAKLYRDLWHSELDADLLKKLKWVDVDSRALTLKSGEQIVDKGFSVSLTKGSDDAIVAAVAIAKAKGWESVLVNGSDEFQYRAALALEAAGMSARITSDMAKARYQDHLTRGQVPPETRPSSSVSVPECPRGIDALKDQVRYVLYRNPLKTIRYVEDDPKRLEAWIRARWGELTRNDEPEGLAVAFRAVAEEFAYMAGYSVQSVQIAGIEGPLSKSMPDWSPSACLDQRKYRRESSTAAQQKEKLLRREKHGLDGLG